MKTVTRARMLEIIRGTKGATFATITTNTDPKLKKTGNPYKEVRKVSTMNICLGFDYENAVNNQRSREDQEMDFIATHRGWGVKVDPQTVEHKGNTYLSAKVEKCYDTKYICGGMELQKENLREFLPKKYSTAQGVEKAVIYRNFKIDNVVSITMHGETFQLF